MVLKLNWVSKGFVFVLLFKGYIYLHCGWVSVGHSTTGEARGQLAELLRAFGSHYVGPENPTEVWQQMLVSTELSYQPFLQSFCEIRGL